VRFGRGDLHRATVDATAFSGEHIFVRVNRADEAQRSGARGSHVCESDAMAMDRVRMGIVGTGNIATLNVPGYLEHEQCDVVAVCDPRPEVLERRMTEWGVERGYTELDQLLADDDIDAVEILSPTPLHASTRSRHCGRASTCRAKSPSRTTWATHGG